MAKAYRPVPEESIGPSRHYRHPAMQEEIRDRVDIYREQVAHGGCIRWLPFRGEGKSARVADACVQFVSSESDEADEEA
ncbi:MAG: hypothetical protein NT031_12560 [Planctomycetota bacterium]|nr:hypothetical protein [Planctomycetota bacterium]